MDTSAALLAGLVAGLAIAAQIGAVSLLLVDTALAAGPRAAVAAGMGVATVDFGFAVVAVLTGGVAGAALSGHETQIHVVAAAVLVAIALPGLIALARRRPVMSAAGTSETDRAPRSHYFRFLAITAVNPLTSRRSRRSRRRCRCTVSQPHSPSSSASAWPRVPGTCS
jgi:threonine/homoserine/homoserine lactone efflux protein